MSLRAKLLIALGYTILIFAVGRYTSNSSKVNTQLQETQKDKKTEDKQVETKKTVTETKKPDGTVTIVTTIDQTIQDQKKEQSSTIVQEKQSTTPPNVLNLSIIGANDFSHAPALTYGLSVTKQILGPVTVGAFGLKNGVLGVSIGFNF